MRYRGVVLGSAALLGVTLGWLAGTRHQRLHRQNLFSPRPLRRLAALGYLEGEANPATVHLLRDYLAWEPRRLLRTRGRRLLRRLEARLG